MSSFILGTSVEWDNTSRQEDCSEPKEYECLEGGFLGLSFLKYLQLFFLPKIISSVTYGGSDHQK